MNKEKNDKWPEVISAFIDELNANPETTPEMFLRKFPGQLEGVTRILAMLIDLREKVLNIQPPASVTDGLFSEIQRRLTLSANTVQVHRRADILILLLYMMRKIWRTDIWGSTKLVKLLFLLGREGKCDQFVTDFYGHYAYSYGAFDKDIPKDINILASKGIVDTSHPNRSAMSPQEIGIESERRVDAVYGLTDRGIKFAAKLEDAANRTNPDIIKSIEQIVRCYGKKSTDDLLTYTYNTYKDTARNSKVKAKYLRSEPKKDSEDHEF